MGNSLHYTEKLETEVIRNDFEAVDVDFIWDEIDKEEDSPDLLREIIELKKTVYHFIKWMQEAFGYSRLGSTRRVKDLVNIALKDFREKSQPTKTHKEKLRTIAAFLIENGSSYPEELRADLLLHFDDQNYQKIIELVASYDMEKRERPEKGKKGPDDPLSVPCDQHIEWQSVTGTSKD